jgi:[protein-PII] uridylyltransferase
LQQPPADAGRAGWRRPLSQAYLSRCKESLREVLGPLDPAPEAVAAAVEAMRGFLDSERHAMAAAFAERPTGGDFCRRQSAIFDAVIGAIYDLAIIVVEFRRGRLPVDADLCVAAVGGYGRAHMAPWSDIDIVFVPAREEHEHIDAVVREMLALLNAVLVPQRHPHVSHSYRPLGDLAFVDHQTATALLESRFIAGDNSLYIHFMQNVLDSLQVVDFVALNIEERDLVWRDRRRALYAVEPDLKTGPGGLRDFHAAVWVAKAVYRIHDWDVLRALKMRGVITDFEQTEVLNALEFILRLRNWLHLDRGQKLDTVHVPYQARGADALGYTPLGRTAPEEFLMRDYFANARVIADFSRRLLALCRQQRMDFRHGLYVEGWTLHATHDRVFQEDPERLVSVFSESQRLRLPLSMGLERLVTQNHGALDATVRDRPQVGARFLDILRSTHHVAATLRDMLRLKVLEQLLPEFAPLLPFLPTDQAHEYSVGEHSLKCVDELERLRAQPNGEDEGIMGKALEALQEPEVLMLAALFHDVGKLDGTGNHSQTGIPVARRVAERLGVNEAAIGRLEFLIREHLTMMRTARLKALSLPDTISGFAAVLPERDPLDALDMLTMLTCADTRSVGRDVLKDTDRRLLMELFAKTAKWLQERSLGLETSDPEEMRQTMGRRLGRAPAMRDIDPEVLRRHLDRLPVWYAANTPPALIAKHITYLERVTAGDDPVVEFYQALGTRHTELTLCTLDRPGLLRDIAGTVFANNLDIYLCQQEIAQGVEGARRQAICTIWVDDFGQSLGQPKRDRLAGDLVNAVRGSETVEEILARRGRRPVDEVVVHSIEASNESSRLYTVVSLRAADERGLLFRVADALFRENLDIRVAKVTTWRGAAEDAFYVVEHGGGQVAEDRLGDLQRNLRERLTPREATAK